LAQKNPSEVLSFAPPPWRYAAALSPAKKSGTIRLENVAVDQASEETMGTLLRFVIAAVALLVVAGRFFMPELRLDLTTLALIAVALLAIFGRGIRIKALDLMGFKVEFDKDDTATSPQNTGITQRDTIIPDSTQISHLPNYGAIDNYITRIIKLTPTEIIAPYVIITSLVENVKLTASSDWKAILLWIVFATFLAVLPIYYFRALGRWDSIAKWQTVFAVVNFCGWALAIGGPFKFLTWYNPVYGAFLLTLSVFALPVVFPSRGNQAAS
jgi:hypothetical protein